MNSFPTRFRAGKGTSCHCAPHVHNVDNVLFSCHCLQRVHNVDTGLLISSVDNGPGGRNVQFLCD